jgi:hypothetical protein
MATSPGKIILKPTPLKVGVEWQIAAQHPSGKIKMICGFKFEIEANEWIKGDSNLEQTRHSGRALRLDQFK